MRITSTDRKHQRAIHVRVVRAASRRATTCDASVPRARSYSVYIPHDGRSDPNAATRMYLEAVDTQGIMRFASFDVT